MPERKPPGAKASGPPVSLETDAEEIRKRIIGLTSKKSVPDPLAVGRVTPISSGLVSLDFSTGIGGVPKGRFISIEGAPGSGKTALALQMVGEEQRLFPKSVHAIIDIEGSISQLFAQMLGVDTDPARFIVLQPETAEEACIMCMSLMGYSIQEKKWRIDPKLKPVSSIIYDSWGGSPTDEVGLAQLARVGSAWIPKIALTGVRTETTLYWINQIREKPGVAFGDPRYSPGGKALKHAQTLLFWVTMVNQIKDPVTKAPIEHDLKVECKKSKIAAPGAPILLHLSYTTGFDQIADAMSLYEAKGVSFKDGNTYTFQFTDEDGEAQKVVAVGREKFREGLEDYPDAGQAFINRAILLAKKGR